VVCISLKLVYGFKDSSNSFMRLEMDKRVRIQTELEKMMKRVESGEEENAEKINELRQAIEFMKLTLSLPT
jgi:hypothetical protein